MAAIDRDAIVLRGAVVVGDVVLQQDANVWYNAVIRGDVDSIHVGSRTNIQDNCVVHVGHGTPTYLGDDVTVGHAAIIHGCTIEDNVLVGMGSIVMDGAHIGSNCIIGAGALVTQGKRIPDGSLVVGTPGKVVRSVTAEEVEGIRRSAREYVAWARQAAEADSARGFVALEGDGSCDSAPQVPLAGD